MTKETTVDDDELLPHVLAIDTEKVYLYDGIRMQTVFSLDDLHVMRDVEALRNALIRLIG